MRPLLGWLPSLTGVSNGPLKGTYASPGPFPSLGRPGTADLQFSRSPRCSRCFSDLQRLWLAQPTTPDRFLGRFRLTPGRVRVDAAPVCTT